MKTWSLVIFSIFISPQLWAQEQMSLRLNEKGILKILRKTIEYNSSSKGGRSVIIPADIYKFTLPKEKILSNPLIPVINEISDLDLRKDLTFYLNTSDIKVNGKVDEQSLKTEIFNSHENGFDFKIKLNLPQVVLTANSLSLCEKLAKNKKYCGAGLKTEVSKLVVKTTKNPITISSVLRLKTSDQVARVSVISANSNLGLSNSPGLDIDFQGLLVPKIAIVIDGQETELDTSKLRGEILKRKDFLAQKLLAFAAEFITQDLAEMINIYLINKQVSTSYQIYRKEGLGHFDEFLSYNREIALRDNTYVAPQVYLPPTYKNKVEDPGLQLIAQITEIIKSAQLGITLKKVSTPANKDIELSGIMSFMLNGNNIKVRNTIGNSGKPLPKLNLNSFLNDDVVVAISEPLVNGALDVANSTKLFQQILNKVSPVKGFSIRNVKFHFLNDKSFVAVVNAQVDLNEVESDGISSWIKNKIGAWLERNNNNSKIYFPIEVRVLPIIKKLDGGRTTLDLKVISPFGGSGLPNSFNYPSNVPSMTAIVRDSVLEQLKDALQSYMNKSYAVDLTKILNQSGVVFLPKTIKIHQNSFLVVGMDLVELKFNASNPNLR